jgi:uncharacterized protein (TIGR02145 family)
MIPHIILLSLLILVSCQKEDFDNNELIDKIPIETGTFIDKRDTTEYKWVKIGNQTWMAENLAYKTNEGSWAYDNDNNLINKFGRLYTYRAAQLACPKGWHLPTLCENLSDLSKYEWYQLIKYVSDSTWSKNNASFNWENAGTYLKEKSQWIEDGSGTNNFGFSALPGGTRMIYNQKAQFNYLYYHGYWWSSSEHSSSDGYSVSLYFNSTGINQYHFNKNFGFSVRCIKDD